MALLEVRDLDVFYGGVQALRGVSLRVEPGQIVALLGANGAGKSTTLRAISGLLRPARGGVFFDGQPLAGLRPHQIAGLGIAHVPEGRGIFAPFTVAENLTIGGYARPRPRPRKGEVAADRERVLTLFPRLRERLGQRAGTLSGGEQQMLAIARALLGRPRLLLLDEPSLGLAPQIVQLIFRVIREINTGGWSGEDSAGGKPPTRTAILLVEQNVHMALNAADYGYVLEVGAITLEGEAASLARNDAVRQAYLGVS